MLDRLTENLRQTTRAVKEEEEARLKLQQTDEWLEAQNEIEKWQSIQQRILAQVPDSREEYMLDKNALIAYMHENRLTELDGFTVETRTRKIVNPTKVIHALDGDLDNFFLLVTITQKNLKEYGDLHPELKKPFKDCVEVDRVEIADISLSTND